MDFIEINQIVPVQICHSVRLMIQVDFNNQDQCLFVYKIVKLKKPVMLKKASSRDTKLYDKQLRSQERLLSVTTHLPRDCTFKPKINDRPKKSQKYNTVADKLVQITTERQTYSKSKRINTYRNTRETRETRESRDFSSGSKMLTQRHYGQKKTQTKKKQILVSRLDADVQVGSLTSRQTSPLVNKTVVSEINLQSASGPRRGETLMERLNRMNQQVDQVMQRQKISTHLKDQDENTISLVTSPFQLSCGIARIQSSRQ